MQIPYVRAAGLESRIARPKCLLTLVAVDDRLEFRRDRTHRQLTRSVMNEALVQLRVSGWQLTLLSVIGTSTRNARCVS